MSQYTVHKGWHIDPQLGTQASKAFKSLDAVFHLDGAQIARDPHSDVLRVTLDSKHYYVKRYTTGGKGLKKFFGRSRVRAEWENLLYFEKWHIPTAHIVAYGEEKTAGIFKRGALITEGIEDTVDLAQLALGKSSLLKERDWVKRVSEQLASMTRKMHLQRFAHNDLKWRNVLVTRDRENPSLYFIDCPTGKFWWGPFLEYRIIKDLACLDKVAKYQLTNTQRLRFYLDYCQVETLSKKDKARIRKILKFFAGRE